MRILPFFYIILLCFSVSYSYADCDFKTGAYIDKLKDSSNIKLIEITTPKSGKFAKNFMKIAISPTKNIPPNLKKSFRANINIHYSFGKCKFKGKVRQSGDWKDHINLLNGGRMIRSLDVKLETGNILSTVHFKLLIPKTRRGENEILTTLILKYLRIISPETFSVFTKINGVSAPMLFQENSRKELLEKNYRREGPLFEGDEELIWSYKNFKNFELKSLALSRIENQNWFKRGSSSQIISLSSYSLLQSAYADFASNKNKKISLNNLTNRNNPKIFSEFMFLLIAMNGSHALSPHNRKFYFNSITRNFEPIYYDGMTSFGPLKVSDLGKPLKVILSNNFTSKLDSKFIQRINLTLNSNELKKEFIKKTSTLNINAINFYKKAILNFKKNIEILNDKIILTNTVLNDFSIDQDQNKSYLDNLQSSPISQTMITKLEKSENGFIATFNSGEKKKLNVEDVSSIISKNKLNGVRTVYLGEFDFIKKSIVQNEIIGFSGKIVTSTGIQVTVLHQNKTISFTQTKQDDWVIIKNAEADDWSFVFNGIKNINKSKEIIYQRFNEFGLTGCLTFYETKFKNTSIRTNGGTCEDSVNIISSDGMLKSISIINAYSDGLDIDYSSLILSKLSVNNAGNDCLDVSAGNYDVKVLNLLNCGDKGVSIGEASNFNSSNIKLNKANIGVSSKDFSQVKLFKVSLANVTICVEAKQKKQEFGGSSLLLRKLKCKGRIEVDRNSVYKEVVN